jgi:hypothetical protein
MTTTIKLNDFAKVIQEMPGKTLEQVRKGTISGVAKSISGLVENSPVDTGLYAQSWNFTADEQSVVLGNTAPHAAIIEEGSRPFTPPIAPLLAWAKRVLKDSSQPPNYSPEVWALAKGTQNKIAQNGMQPRKVLEGMLPTILENIRQEIKLSD